LPAFFLREKLLTIGTFGLCGFAMFIQLYQVPVISTHGPILGVRWT
jgi:hypothetical protein